MSMTAVSMLFAIAILTMSKQKIVNSSNITLMSFKNYRNMKKKIIANIMLYLKSKDILQKDFKSDMYILQDQL